MVLQSVSVQMGWWCIPCVKQILAAFLNGKKEYVFKFFHDSEYRKSQTQIHALRGWTFYRDR